MSDRPRDWNAASYQRVSAPLEAMGREVLDRLELDGDERVLDAGCGTGRVTAALVERLPRGQVVAVDGSPSMVEQARERLGPGVEVFVADLLELELDEPVDAILSTATFHWIPDHDRLFERLSAALRPGGRIVAQCGGAGNVASVQAAIDAVAEPALEGWAGPWNFQSPADTAARLERIGFTGIRTWPQDVRVEPDDMREYLGTVMLGSHLERIPEERRAAFVEAVLAELPRAGDRLRPPQPDRPQARLNAPESLRDRSPRADIGPMSLLRRRRKLEPVPSSAAPPADGAAPCLDAFSRRRGTEPIAGVFVDWATAEHYCGFGAGYCGVWHADDPLTPLDRFAIGPAGCSRPTCCCAGSS